MTSRNNTAIGYSALQTPPRHLIASHGIYCDGEMVIGAPRDGGPIIIGRVGTRLALELLWHSLRRKGR